MKKGPIIAGLICGVACVVCVLVYASLVQDEADTARAEAMERYGGEQVDVIVATEDIYPGDVLTSSNTTTQTWLSDLLPADCITSLDDVSGLQVTSLIIEGEAISTRRFDSSTNELEVPSGYTAVSMPAEDVQAVGGALSVGSLVDVYAVGTETTCLGTDMLVLATNADTSDSSSSGTLSWITLAVPSEQSQEFVTASQSLDIYFVLPSVNGDTDEEATSSSSSEEQDEDLTEQDGEVANESSSD